MNAAHKRLLELMADGTFHSGQQLADYLNVTRTSVWKYLQQFQDVGLEIRSRHGLGYCLAQPLELLDASIITQMLTQNAKRHCAEIEIIEKINSTNSHLYNQLNSAIKPGKVVMAEFQTKGKGRRGHQWVSPFASGLNFSLFWRQQEAHTNIGALSLIVGVAVIRCLKKAGIRHAGLKWPNDIVVEDNKLGGILIELQGEANGPVNIIIGVGLNYRLPESGLRLEENTATDIYTHVDKSLKRNELAAKLISSIFDVLDEIEHERHIELINEWRQYDVYKGREASILINDSTLTGTLSGVNDDGCLLMDIQGKQQHFACGELSLRIKS